MVVFNFAFLLHKIGGKNGEKNVNMPITGMCVAFMACGVYDHTGVWCAGGGTTETNVA